MSEKAFSNKDLSQTLVDIGLIMGSTKPGTIIASKSAERADKESIESKLNKKINKILR